MVVWIACAYAAAAAAEPTVDVRVDDAVLLVSSAYFLADAGREYARSADPEYAAALRTHLDPLSESPAVTRLRRMKVHGFDLDAPLDWAVRLDPETLAPTSPLPPELVARAGGEAELTALAAELKKFRADPAWGTFVRDEGPVHQAAVDRLKEAVAAFDAPSGVRAFYGDGATAYTWAVAPALGPSAWPIQVGSTVTIAASPLAYPGAELADRFPYIALREVGQPIAEALVEAHWDRLQLAEGLLPPVEKAMAKEDLADWRAVVPELIGRAATCRMLRDARGEDAGSRCVIQQVARGFRYVPALYDAFGEYEADRATWPTLDSFTPRIVEVLLAIQHDGVDEWWQGQRWATGALSLDGAISRVTTVVVYPTIGPDAADVAAYADRLAKRCGGHAMPDTEAVGYHALEKRYLVLGTPASNALLARYADQLPWRFDADGVTVAGVRVEGADGVRLLSMLPNPDGPRGDPWVVLTASSDKLIPGMEAMSHDPAGWIASAPDGARCAEGALLPDAEAGPTVSCPQ